VHQSYFVSLLHSHIGSYPPRGFHSNLFSVNGIWTLRASFFCISCSAESHVNIIMSLWLQTSPIHFLLTPEYSVHNCRAEFRISIPTESLLSSRFGHQISRYGICSVSNCTDNENGIEDLRSTAVEPSNRDFRACRVMNSQSWPLNDQKMSFPCQALIAKIDSWNLSLLILVALDFDQIREWDGILGHPSRRSLVATKKRPANSDAIVQRTNLRPTPGGGPPQWDGSDKSRGIAAGFSFVSICFQSEEMQNEDFPHEIKFRKCKLV
jgi:hypothetical protein